MDRPGPGPGPGPGRCGKEGNLGPRAPCGRHGQVGEGSLRKGSEWWLGSAPFRTTGITERVPVLETGAVGTLSPGLATRPPRHQHVLSHPRSPPLGVQAAPEGQVPRTLPAPPTR